MVSRLLDMRRERIKEMDMHHIFYYPPYSSVLIPSRGNVPLIPELGSGNMFRSRQDCAAGASRVSRS